MAAEATDTRFHPARHSGRFAPEYPPHGHSDHLPMAWLAMQGLGADAVRREAFAAAYLPRLQPLAPEHPLARRQREWLCELRADGTSAVLGRHLPRLVSGWYREAYHPLIRLGYAVEFDVPEEAAAALAYLEASGPSPRVEELADTSRHLKDASGLDLLRRAAGLQVNVSARASFSERAETVLAQSDMAELAWVIDDNLRRMSLAALAAFDATHDFFALHLLTGSHAFRLIRPWAGPRADAILNLGLLAGYLAIGAPPIPDMDGAADEPGEIPAEARARLLLRCADDEHDLKVAYSGWAQARHWQCGRYITAVERYLTVKHGT